MSIGFACRRERLDEADMCGKAPREPLGHDARSGLPEDEYLIGLEKEIGKGGATPEAVLEEAGDEGAVK